MRDCDDVFAVCTALQHQRFKRCSLRAVVHNTAIKQGPKAIEAILRYWKRGHVEGTAEPVLIGSYGKVAPGIAELSDLAPRYLQFECEELTDRWALGPSGEVIEGEIAHPFFKVGDFKNA